MSIQTPSTLPINGWSEWGKHVLKELERLEGCYQKMVEKVGKNQVDIAMLQVKSGIWGAIAGLIPATIVVIYVVIKLK